MAEGVELGGMPNILKESLALALRPMTERRTSLQLGSNLVSQAPPAPAFLQLTTRPRSRRLIQTPSVSLQPVKFRIAGVQGCDLTKPPTRGRMSARKQHFAQYTLPSAWEK